jgi:membrane protein YdbS with pleckstrin-like domain
MDSLHPRTVILWRAWALTLWLILAALVALLELAVLAPAGAQPITTGFLTGLVAALGVAYTLGWPPLRYRHWRWAVEPDRVLIERGVIWRSRSLIPRVRVQHVDTRTSPLQRWLGLSSLIIYTAGTRGADAEIPGLTAADAERLREELAELEDLDERA